ncbi:MAG: hypothetical protein ACREE9_04650 [Stellaceae bacterium]
MKPIVIERVNPVDTQGDTAVKLRLAGFRRRPSAICGHRLAIHQRQCFTKLVNNVIASAKPFFGCSIGRAARRSATQRGG